MVWGVIGYTSQLPVLTESTLSSDSQISVVLKPMAISFIQILRNITFQQNIAGPHVAGIARTFLDVENVLPLPQLAYSPNLSTTENVRSMIAEKLNCRCRPDSAIDDLWHLVEGT